MEAVKKSGVRALVSAGWGGLGGADVPDEVFILEGMFAPDAPAPGSCNRKYPPRLAFRRGSSQGSLSSRWSRYYSHWFKEWATNNRCAFLW
jgi:hypothetical protein